MSFGQVEKPSSNSLHEWAPEELSLTILIGLRSFSAGFPGWSVDACLDSLFLGMLGAVIGGLNFLILAKLAPYPVGQAVVFFPILYSRLILSGLSWKYWLSDVWLVLFCSFFMMFPIILSWPVLDWRAQPSLLSRPKIRNTSSCHWFAFLWVGMASITLPWVPIGNTPTNY
jgi:hypothetical protein